MRKYKTNLLQVLCATLVLFDAPIYAGDKDKYGGREAVEIDISEWSLTLSKETFIEVVADVCRSLAHHGFDHIVLVPTHGGNFAPLAKAVQAFRPELPGVNLIAFTDLMVFMDEIFQVGQAREVTPEQAGAHSGEFETSLMLTVRPDLVAMDNAQPGYVGDQLGIAAVVFEKGFRAATENGVLGDPRDASSANGEAYLAALTDLLVGYIKAHKRK